MNWANFVRSDMEWSGREGGEGLWWDSKKLDWVYAEE